MFLIRFHIIKITYTFKLRKTFFGLKRSEESPQSKIEKYELTKKLLREQYLQEIIPRVGITSVNDEKSSKHLLFSIFR